MLDPDNSFVSQDKSPQAQEGSHKIKLVYASLNAIDWKFSEGMQDQDGQQTEYSASRKNKRFLEKLSLCSLENSKTSQREMNKMDTSQEICKTKEKNEFQGIQNECQKDKYYEYQPKDDSKIKQYYICSQNEDKEEDERKLKQKKINYFVQEMEIPLESSGVHEKQQIHQLYSIINATQGFNEQQNKNKFLHFEQDKERRKAKSSISRKGQYAPASAYSFTNEKDTMVNEKDSSFELKGILIEKKISQIQQKTNSRQAYRDSSSIPIMKQITQEKKAICFDRDNKNMNNPWKRNEGIISQLGRNTNDRNYYDDNNSIQDITNISIDKQSIPDSKKFIGLEQERNRIHQLSDQKFGAISNEIKDNSFAKETESKPPLTKFSQYLANRQQRKQKELQNLSNDNSSSSYRNSCKNSNDNTTYQTQKFLPPIATQNKANQDENKPPIIIKKQKLESAKNYRSQKVEKQIDSSDANKGELKKYLRRGSTPNKVILCLQDRRGLDQIHTKEAPENTKYIKPQGMQIKKKELIVQQKGLRMNELPILKIQNRSFLINQDYPPKIAKPNIVLKQSQCCNALVKDNDNQIQNKNQSSQRITTELYPFMLPLKFTKKDIQGIIKRMTASQIIITDIFNQTIQQPKHSIDNFELAIDVSSTKDEIIFTVSFPKEEERLQIDSKGAQKVEDCSTSSVTLKIQEADTIASEWQFQKCLKCESSGETILSGKNTRTGLVSSFWLMDSQKNLMGLMKWMGIIGCFAHQSRNPCIQMNGHVLLFTESNTIGFETDSYVDIEQFNTAAKLEARSFSDQQVLFLLREMLINIQQLHSRRIAINDLNVHNIVFAKDTASFKILQCINATLIPFGKEDSLDLNQQILKNENVNNYLYQSSDEDIQKNAFARDIYALGICAVIFRNQLTGFQINKSIVDEKLAFNSEQLAQDSENKQKEQNLNASVQVERVIKQLVSQDNHPPDIRSDQLAQYYLQTYFNIPEICDNKSSEENTFIILPNIGAKLKKYNIFSEDSNKTRVASSSSNNEIDRLCILRDCYKRCAQQDEFFNIFERIVQLKRRTYGVSSTMFLETLLAFFVEAVIHSKKIHSQAAIDIIHSQNLYSFITLIPSEQLALQYLVLASFHCLLDSHTLQAVSHLRTALKLALSPHNLFQININLANILSNSQSALPYLASAKEITQQITLVTIDLAAPFLLSGQLRFFL